MEKTHTLFSQTLFSVWILVRIVNLLFHPFFQGIWKIEIEKPDILYAGSGRKIIILQNELIISVWNLVFISFRFEVFVFFVKCRAFCTY